MATKQITGFPVTTVVDDTTIVHVNKSNIDNQVTALNLRAYTNQTGAEIKAAYEGEAGTNEFSDAEQTKLAGIETAATADQSNAEIKTAYELNADTNEFNDAEKTKLGTVATDANNYSHPNHTGDVTSTGDGATVIANSAVTLPKMANIATDSFLGRDTAATGNVEVLTPTQVRTILGIESGATADQSASEVPFTATGGISSTDVQSALSELDGEKLSIADNLSDLANASTARTNLSISAANTPSNATGTIVATNVQAALAELNTDATDHLGDTVGAHDASAISNIAAGNIEATDVQAALNELDVDKIAQTKIDEINATPNANAVVDVLVYQTSLDSEGGLWRKRTSHTSWYNETLNTATRGATREFPAVALIVAEDNKVTIYDATDAACPMWMVFTGNLGNMCRAGATYDLTSTVMLNGTLVFGCINGASIQRVNFISEEGILNNTSLNSRYNGTISERNDVLSYTTLGAIVVANGTINDIAITVLDDAPIDSETGLPVPTIAVATGSSHAGGLGSVIMNDGTVVDYNQGGNHGTSVAFLENNDLVWGFSASSLTGIIPLSDVDIVNTSPDPSFRGYSNGTVPSNRADGNKTSVAMGNDIATASVSLSETGVILIKEDTTTPANGMVNYITSEYQSGWMQGDIKGAFLSSTTAETIGVDETTELVTNGTFDTDISGWVLGKDAGATAAHEGTNFTIKLTNDGDGGVTSFQSAITTVIGKTYFASAEITAISSGNGAVIKSDSATDIVTNAVTILSDTGTVTESASFVATATTTYIHVTSSSPASSTVEYDNISVKQTGNLVLNGTFDVDTSGWIDSSEGTGSTAWNASGYINLVTGADSSNEGITTQSFATVIGSSYVVAAEKISGNSIVQLDNFGQSGGLFQSANDAVNVAGTFVATAATTYITLRNFDNFSATSSIDNISVRLADPSRSV